MLQTNIIIVNFLHGLVARRRRRHCTKMC